MMTVKIRFETTANSVDINEIVNIINSSLNGNMSTFKIDVQGIPKIEYPIMGEEYLKKEQERVKKLQEKEKQAQLNRIMDGREGGQAIPPAVDDSVKQFWHQGTAIGTVEKIDRKDSLLGLWKTEDGQFVKITRKIKDSVWYGINIPSGFISCYNDNGMPLEFVNGSK